MRWKTWVDTVLSAITGANVDVDADKLALVDDSADATKYITVKELIANTTSFTAFGSGAVSRSVQSELRDLYLNVKGFGAVGDGVTDDTAAIQAAMTAAKTAGGRIVYFPTGTYLCASQLSITGGQGLHLKGEAATGSVMTGGSTIKYSGTATPFLTLGSGASNSTRTLIEDLNVYYTSGSFTGTLVKAVGSGLEISRAMLSGSGSSTGLYLLDLDSSSTIRLRSVEFHNCQYGISGQDSGGAGSCNAVEISGCLFNSGLTVAGIRNPGQAWHISGTVFEALADLTGAAIVTDAACTAVGTSLIGCWLGDASSNTVYTWIKWKGRGLVVKGCYIHGNGGLTATGIALVAGATSFGIDISGNHLDGFDKAIDIGTSIASDCSIGPNRWGSSTTHVSGTPVDNYFTVQSSTWTPTFTNLTVVNGTGGATYSGAYTKYGTLVRWSVVISVTGTCTTASTAGATFIDNLPFTTGTGAAAFSTCEAVDGGTVASYGIGLVTGVAAKTPSWAATNTQIVISGSYQTAA